MGVMKSDSLLQIVAPCHMKKLLPLFLLLTLVASCKKGDNQHPVPLDISGASLQNYHVISIAFEASGTAWLGTLSQGLIRQDAAGIVVFDSTNSILHKAPIWDIKVDKKGNLWIGSDDLIRYDGTKFTRFESKEFGMRQIAVRSIGIDAEDHIWFAAGTSGEGGLVEYDGNRFSTFTPKNSALPGNLIAGVAIDQQNTIWAALNDGVNTRSIVRIREGKWEVFGAKELGFSPYYFGNIVTSRQNELFVSIDYGLSSTMVPGRPQLFRFNGQLAKIIPLPQEEKVFYMTHPGVRRPRKPCLGVLFKR